MDDKILTKKRLEILSYIESCVRDKGFPPSVREIAKSVNLSSASSVHSHLNTLVSGGYLIRDPSKPRAIRVNMNGNADNSASNKTDLTMSKTEPVSDAKVSQIPILGSVAAGAGVLAEENIEDYLNISPSLLGSGSFFALRVRGESMINAGIFNDDLLICRSQNTAEMGEIVIAGINDNEATVKYYHRDKEDILLKPANDNFKVIKVKEDEVTIFGKAVTVIRSLI